MKAKILAAVVTISILTMLIISGPANAFILGLTILDTEVLKGEAIDFQASVQINSNEFLDLSYLTLNIKGPAIISCKFKPDGKVLRGCGGLKIKRVETTEYGFGYGYGTGFTNGTLAYNITLDTKRYQVGTYTTELNVNIGDQKTRQAGENITILSKSSALRGCSFRARDGQLVFDEFSSNLNKFNFHIPLAYSADGKGSLTGQSGRERISYNFELIEVQDNNPHNASILVSGEFKINGDKTVEDATIFFDKDKQRVKISGENLNVINMNVYFIKNC